MDLIEAKKPPGVMAILDDVCFTMHAQTEGADMKFVQVCTRMNLIILRNWKVPLMGISITKGIKPTLSSTIMRAGTFSLVL